MLKPEACLCVDSVKKRSSEGLEAARTELEEREKVREELHGVQLWLQAADVLLKAMEQGRSTEDLQVRDDPQGQVTSCSMFLLKQYLQILEAD